MDHERIGKYRIVGELGRGTMGEVYKAYDGVLNRHVALKTMAMHAGPGDEALERFQREAQAAALLNHPNIVTVHDFGRDHGLLFMAMELLEGTDLREAIDHETLASLDHKLDLMDAVLAALEYAHSKGVIHRDIKPANIHLGPGGQVKIMDFGLARISSSEITQEGIVLGTPNYMSPEQALGDRVDCRSDLFSTGAVLYELLTGHKPFEADSTPSVLFQVVHKEPPPVRRWAANTPAEIVAVVERSLRKDREQRFSSATQMREALAAARKAALAPPVLKPPPLPVRPPRPSGPIAVPPSIRVQGAPPLPPRAAAVPPAPASPSEPSTAIAPEPAREAGDRIARRGLAPALRVAGAVVALLVLAWVTASYWLGHGLMPRPLASPSAAAERVGVLTYALVTTQVQLAQRELEDKNYAAATRQAQSALKLVAGHPGAMQVIAQARDRMKELEAAIDKARELADRGETEAASQQLSRALELDPRHPAVAELAARLNSAFQAEAAKAEASMRSARAAASGGGAAAGAEFAAADEKADAAAALVAQGEYADAARAFLDARDGFDRARRAARPRSASPARGTSGADSGPASPGAAMPSPSARTFEAEATAVATPAVGGLEGFDSDDVSTRRPPEFSGQLRFEVTPTTVRPGDSFLVRIHASNEARRTVRVRSIALATVSDGRRTPAAVKIVQREMRPQKSTLLAEYSGVWQDVSSWALEAVVTSERNETITARLRSH